MHTVHSVRRAAVLGAIVACPGITKRELASRFGLSPKALEMHLMRIVSANQAHSVSVPGESHRAWYPGPPQAASFRLVSSIFNMGLAT